MAFDRYESGRVIIVNYSKNSRITTNISGS
jgi:hypothetical protein